MYICILKNNSYEFLYIHHPILEMEHYHESIVIKTVAILTKRSIYQEDSTVLLFVSNIIASKYLKQKTELQGEIDKSIFIGEYFNILGLRK